MHGGFGIRKLIVLIFAFLFSVLLSGIGTATEITIRPGTSVIQAAVNNSSPGDVIVLTAGTYYDNVNITKENLTIKSASGNPDDTWVKAYNSKADVFHVQADKTNIYGLKISGALATRCSAINLSWCHYCSVENNKLDNNLRGINLLFAHWSVISGNTATNNNEYGIDLQNATANIISENKVYNNIRGINFGNSDSNTLTNNNVTNNNVSGFSICGRCDQCIIYNNYFNATNISIGNGIGNSYNVTRTAGPNIVGGPYIGGNYWGTPDGTGFSQKAIDSDKDGFSDSIYTNISGSKYSDYLPLVINGTYPIPPVANFSSNVTEGYVPLCVKFNDTSTGAPTKWNWKFGDGNTSIEKSPMHTYSAAGNYTVNLTVNNTNGTSSKLATINVSTKPSLSIFPGCTKPPLDPNSDGLYEDINGNGKLDFSDVVTYYNDITWITQNGLVTYFDYNKNSRIDFNDVIMLYNMH